MPVKAVSKIHSRAARDLAVLGAASALILIVAAYYDGFEQLIRLARRPALVTWQLDELFILLMVLSVGFTIFSWRRWQDLKREKAAHALSKDALQASEANVRALMETSAQQLLHLGSWHWHLATNMLTWSDGMYRVCGAEHHAGEITQKFILKHIHPDGRRQMRQTLKNVLCDHQPFSLDCRIIRPDGEPRILQVRGKVVLDPAGQPSDVIGTAQDVTERWQAEQELHQGFEQLQTIYALSAALARAEALEEVYAAALNGARRALQVDKAAIRLFDDDGVLRFKAWLGLSETYRRAVPNYSTPWPQEDETPRPILAPDITRATQLAEGCADVLNEGIRALALIPLVYQGRIIGQFSIYYPELHEFALEEIQLAQAIASHIAIAIERKRVDESLKQSEKYYRDLFENAHDAIILIHPEREIVLDANQRACEVYGFTREEFIGTSLEQLTLNPAQGRRRLAETLASTDCRNFETIQYRKDGGQMFLEINASVVEHRGERAILSINRDITERKRNEEQLVRLATVVEQSAESIIITDRRGRIQYVNPAFERTTGYTREEALGKTERLIRNDKMDAETYKQMRAILKRGEVWTGHFTSRKKDGTRLEEEGSISPVRDGAGRVVNYVSVKRNVTQERALEAQLRQSQKMEAVGRLAGGVAHDFNNLLTVISGYSQLALGRLSNDDPLAADIHEVAKAAERATSLTRQLLAFSRKQVMQPKVLDLNGIVADTEKMLRRLIGEDIELVTMKQPELARVKADPGQIEQVIMNLVVNARDAMPEGGRLTITTANVAFSETDTRPDLDMPAGQYALLSIHDTGCGMDHETLSHIFEPFFTTKGIGEGTGLGLSTVYGIVQQSGGFIDTQSKPGQGTRFNVYLPQIILAGAEPVERPATDLPGGKETILLVEDELAVRNLTSHVLKKLGYNVWQASGGLEALRLLKDQPQEPVHLLLTDVVMPQMNGSALARLIKDLRPDTRVLLASGYTDDALARHGVLESEMAFLQKPFTPASLARKVREVLEA